jgi:hypothetical protein
VGWTEIAPFSISSAHPTISHHATAADRLTDPNPRINHTKQEWQDTAHLGRLMMGTCSDENEHVWSEPHPRVPAYPGNAKFEVPPYCDDSWVGWMADLLNDENVSTLVIPVCERGPLPRLSRWIVSCLVNMLADHSSLIKFPTTTHTHTHTQLWCFSHTARQHISYLFNIREAVTAHPKLLAAFPLLPAPHKYVR